MQGNPSFAFIQEHDYGRAAETAAACRPDVAVVEVPESKGRQTKDYLDICAEIRAICPRCKLMIMCPESSSISKQTAIAAMQAGDIDDFLFYDSTLEYFVSKLKVLAS